MMKRLSLVVIVAMILQLAIQPFFGRITYAVNDGFTFTEVKLSYDSTSELIAEIVDGNIHIPDAEVDVTQDVRIEYKWELSMDHEFEEGSTYTFRLPEGVKLYDPIVNYNLYLPDGDSGPDPVGTMSADTNGNVTITFGEWVEPGLPLNGDLYFWSLALDVETNEDGVFELELLDGYTITLKKKQEPIVEKEVRVEKSGQKDKQLNASKIDWTVKLNTEQARIANARFEDELEAGLTYTNGELYELTESGAKLINDVPIQYDPGNRLLTVDFAGHGASVIEAVYEIRYTTTIVDLDSLERTYENTAVLTGDNGARGEDTASVEVERGKPLEKSYRYNDSTHPRIEWTIEYNKGEREIAEDQAYIIDLFNHHHELELVNPSGDPNDPDNWNVRVYEAVLTNNGTLNKKSSTPLALGTDYRIDLLDSDDAPWTGRLPAGSLPTGGNYTDKAGFLIQFEDDIEGTPYIIEYVTKPEESVRNHDELLVDNTAFTSGGIRTETSTVRIGQRIFLKERAGVDYSNQQVSWRVTINRDNYELKDLVYTDVIPSEMRLVEDSLRIGSDAPAADKVTLTTGADGNVTAFTIDLGETSETIEITYKTEYEFVPDRHDNTVVNKESYENKGGIEWRYVEEDSTSQLRAKSGEATFRPNERTYNNGYKAGSYDADAQEINWSILINYNGKTMTNVTIEDVIQGVQQYQVDSLTVRSAVVATDGNSVTPVGALDEDDYSVTVPSEGNGNQLVIHIPGAITEPLLVEFTTSLKGQVINDKSTKIENMAKFRSDEFAEKELQAEVSIPEAGKFVDKTGKLNDGNRYQMDWTIVINESSSTITNAKLLDILSDNQVFLTETFKLYKGKYSGSGTDRTVVKDGPALDPEGIYSIAFTDTPVTFTMSFLEDLTEPYVLEYSSMLSIDAIESGSGDVDIENKAELSGNGTASLDGSNGSTIREKINLSGGGGSVVIPETDLLIVKVDSMTGEPVPGAEFKVVRANNDAEVARGVTDADGQFQTDKLKYGKYKIIEVKAPFGYKLDTTPIEVTLAQSTTVEREVENVRTGTGKLEILKVDSERTDRALEGAKFEVYALDDDGEREKLMTTLTTDAEGKASVDGLPIGDYQLEEVEVPTGYLLEGDGLTDFAIAIDTTTSLTIHNIPGKGNIELEKVDEADPNLKLAGAVFELYPLDDEGNREELLDTAVTDEEGMLTFEDILVGDYVLKEITSPSGYWVNGNGETIVTVEKDQTVTVTVENIRVRGGTSRPPSNPERPADREQPVDPEQPADPEEPADSEEPTDPEQPVEPEQPADPADHDAPRREVTEQDTLIEGEVPVMDGETPEAGEQPENGTLVVYPEGRWIYTPNPGFAGQDSFSITIRDAEGNERDILFEIDVKEVPTGDMLPDVDTLPQTGEHNYLPLQLTGVGLLLAAFAMVFRTRLFRRSSAEK